MQKRHSFITKLKKSKLYEKRQPVARFHRRARLPAATVDPASSSTALVEASAAGRLCKNALKAVSRQRLMTTYIGYRESSAWREFDGICTPDGCMSLDDIDLLTDRDSIHCQWNDFAKLATELPCELDELDTSTCHHATCHMECGVCKLSPGMSLATKYVHALASMLKDGRLAFSDRCSNPGSEGVQRRKYLLDFTTVLRMRSSYGYELWS